MKDLNFDQNKQRKVSEGLKNFLRKALEKDPEKRASVFELQEDQWLSSE